MRIGFTIIIIMATTALIGIMAIGTAELAPGLLVTWSGDGYRSPELICLLAH